MKIVLFLGAGFSAPLGQPTMNDFLQFADSSSRLTEEDRNLLGRLILDTRSANSFLQSSPTNLEDILSFAVMGDRLAIGPDHGERAKGILRILRKIYSQVPNSNTYWEQFDAVEQFLEPDRFDKHQMSFVTTNYDLNLESAFQRMGGKRADPGFNFVQVTGPHQSHGQLYARGGVPLFKLHGSVNWFPNDEDPGSLLVEGRVVEVHAPPMSNRVINHLPLACAGNYEPPHDPVLVPPTYLKPDVATPIRQVWQGAAGALHEAHVVIFVGYSFPPTDTEMRYFLARSLADNPALRRILLIDIAAVSIADRLRAPDSCFGTHFKAFLEPIQNSWTKAKVKL